MNLEEMKQAVVEALEDVKAIDIRVLDVSQLTSVTSCMIIATGSSNRHTRALADNVQKKLKERGVRIHGVEGAQEGEWVLVDLGDIVVHIMLPSARDYYNLEQLWGAAESRRHGARSGA
ncbi:MAG: ribosome silencing factor [Methylophilaceae bacterium]|nr:ribosome silencing factor [Methylophilaceae bacterium]